MNSATQDFQDLDRQLAAKRPLLFVKTLEEERFQDYLTSRHTQLWIWKASRGLSNPEGQTVADTVCPEKALDYILQQTKPSGDGHWFWFQDFAPFFGPAVNRRLRDLYACWRGTGNALFITSSTSEIPSDLKRELWVLDLDVPDQQEIKRYVEAWAEEQEFCLKPPLTPQLISAVLRGLTQADVWHALMRIKSMDLDPKAALALLKEEKKALISENPSLSFVTEVPEFNELGGLENLKEWLLERKELLTSDDPALREIVPKGILLMGVSGCGKSLCVKAVSSAWNLPLYRLEMIQVFSGASGNPEQAFADALRLMEKMAPALLWIDEVEMGLSAEGSSISNPVMARIFSYFLTWMQEKTPGLFVAATANRIDLLPAEMIRKGRFDQVFFVDLPEKNEREAIYRIHLQKRGYDPNSFTPEVFADAMANWNGAEIEQCVVSAITQARMEGRDMELRDLYSARKEIVPLATTMEAQVRHIRNWAFERAVRASRLEND